MAIWLLVTFNLYYMVVIFYNVKMTKKNGTRWSYSWLLKSSILSVKLCQWPWMTSNPDLKDTPIFDIDYLKNSTRYRHSYDGVLCDLLTSVVSNDLEWHLVATTFFDIRLLENGTR